MFLFLRLVLGHLIGDFILQTNKIYELKHHGLRGGLPHALFIAASYIAVSWPYLALPQVWLFILFLGLTHLLQDSLKVGFAGFAKYSFWLYLTDQFSHIALISTVFLTDLRNLPPPVPINRLVFLYNHNSAILYLIALIAATYNGFYLIRSFKVTFYAHAAKYTRFEKWYEILERALIVTVFALPQQYFLFIPLALLRFVVFALVKNKDIVPVDFIKPREIFLSWIIAVTVGIIFLLLEMLIRYS